MANQPMKIAVLAMVGGLIAGACNPPASTTGPASAPPAATGSTATAAPASEAPGGEPTAAPSEPNLPAVPTGYTELDQALGADMPMKGTNVRIINNYLSADFTGAWGTSMPGTGGPRFGIAIEAGSA